MIHHIVRAIKTIYLFIRFSAIGFTIFLPLLGVASVHSRPTNLLLFGTLLIAISFHIYAYILNDIIDLEIDKTEFFKAEYPLVRGTVKKKCAFIFALIMVPISFFITYLLNSSFIPSLSLGGAFLFMTLYNLYGKRISIPVLMDIVQGIGWAFLVLLGAQLTGNTLSELTWIIAVLAIIYILMINGIHGSLRDLENDSNTGANTTAIIMGARMYNSMEIKFPKPLLMYTFFLQGVFSFISLMPLINNILEYQDRTWWILFIFLIIANGISIFLLIRAIQSASVKWDLYYYGMFHLVLILGIFLIPFLFTLPWTWLITLLFLYIVPVAMILFFGGVKVG